MTTETNTTSTTFLAGTLAAIAALLGLAWLGHSSVALGLACASLGGLWYFATVQLVPPLVRASNLRDTRIAELEAEASEVRLAAETLVRLASSLTPATQTLDDATRAAAYQAVQQKVHDAAVWIPLYHEPLFLVSGNRMKPMKAHGNYGCAMYKGLGIALK